ncbi:MAG: hypothetical protein ACD_46C00194G0007 [uncultured bacterium]|nr:MAG: hypothetical protein ACD_46C00194G0007 [uncultured bacterium]
MSAPRTQNTAGNIATTMRKEGMSTVQILRALFQAQINLREIRSLSDGLIIDVRAAQVADTLKETVNKTINKLTSLSNFIQDNIDRLQANKQTAAIASSYAQQQQPLGTELQKTTEEVKQLQASTNNYIHELRKKISELATRVKNQSLSKMEVIQSLKLPQEELLKLEKELKKIEDKQKDLLNQLTILANNSETSARAVGGPKPMSQTPTLT